MAAEIRVQYWIHLNVLFDKYFITSPFTHTSAPMCGFALVYTCVVHVHVYLRSNIGILNYPFIAMANRNFRYGYGRPGPSGLSKRRVTRSGR